MSFFDLFRKKRVHPEDDYEVIIAQEILYVKHPNQPSTKIHFSDIHTILLINTDAGPLLPDVWLTLIAGEGKYMIPQGAKGFEEVYGIVSKYEGFDFENFIRSMSCTENAEFLLWKKLEK